MAEYARILVGIDRDGGDHALTAAIAMAAPNAALTLLTSVPPPHWLVYASGYPPSAVTTAAQEAGGRLLRGAAHSVPAHLGVRTVLSRGALATALVAETQAQHYDVVAVEFRRRGRLGGAPFARGMRILRRCGTPILIVAA